jgi:NAD(P)-dependent dehydrogenase (short-subunit alcohol dehydrogenase family)
MDGANEWHAGPTLARQAIAGDSDMACLWVQCIEGRDSARGQVLRRNDPEPLHKTKEQDMNSKVAMVVGGGSGMGAAAARKLAHDGFQVAVLSSSGKGEALGRELGGLGLTGSNQSSEDLQKLVDQTMARWGRIDVLVNSAGHGPKGPVLELTDAQWHLGLDMYFLNVVRAVRVVAPIMVQQKAGAIVNISSAWVVEPSAMFPTSAVARAGLAAFTKLFADEHAAHNVRMNNVLPGWIDSLPAKEERRESVPMQRYGTSEEVAATIAFLASEGAAYITGQNIRIDGGLMRSI